MINANERKIICLCFLTLTLLVSAKEKYDFHPRFSKLVNKYQNLRNYFAKAKIKVITKSLSDNTTQKQEVSFDLGYSNHIKNVYFEKSHLKMVNSEQTIQIVSDGKNIYKYIMPLNQYTKTPIKNSHNIVENINDLTLSLIFAPERIFQELPETVKFSSLRYKIYENEEREILFIKGKSNKERFFLILHIQKSTGLVIKWVLNTIHSHNKHLILNILRAKYFGIKYNVVDSNVKSAFVFFPPKDSSLVDEFDVGKYYDSIKEKLNSYINKKIDIPSFTPLNFDNEIKNGQKKFILLEFWSTWCKICKSEIPLLNKIHDNFSDELDIIAISFEKEGILKKFISTYSKSIHYKIARYNADKSLEPYTYIVQYPTAFLVAPDLTLKKVWVGEKDAEIFKEYFEKLFRKK